MQRDFHYYATYCAAIIAGYTHEESMQLCYADQLVDGCSKTFLAKVHGPLSAATTQIGTELVNVKTDILDLQDTTRIWASFHFLPRDLHAKPPRRCSKRYRNKYRLICGPNGELVAETVKLAKDASLAAAGIAMHVLADTWAHRYFAGTPSLVINNTNYYFFELVQDGQDRVWRPVRFKRNPMGDDDLEQGIYLSSPPQIGESSPSNLGHGRAGHLPDYSFITYRYMPAWADYEEVVKDNPREYLLAFTQMIHAMKYLRGECDSFELERYDMDAIAPWEERIRTILEKRQLDACSDWKALGEELSGCTIEDFDLEKYQEEYLSADESDKDGTYLGQFILGALAQKSMVTNKIYRSGNLIAGHSIEYDPKGYKGIRDYLKLAEQYFDDGQGGEGDD